MLHFCNLAVFLPHAEAAAHSDHDSEESDTAEVHTYSLLSTYMYIPSYPCTCTYALLSMCLYIHINLLRYMISKSVIIHSAFRSVRSIKTENDELS